MGAQPSKTGMGQYAGQQSACRRQLLFSPLLPRLVDKVDKVLRRLVVSRGAPSCSASGGLSLFLPGLGKQFPAPTAFASPFAASRPQLSPQLPLAPYGGAVKAAAVPHIHQQFNWDCGLACVLMVLRAAAPKAACMDLATLRQYCPTTRCACISALHSFKIFTSICVTS